MELTLPKIELYKTRTFSEKLSDTFNFLRENWRPIAKYFLYLMVPASIVLAFFMNHFWSGYMGIIMNAEGIGTGQVQSELLSFGLNAGITLLLFLIASVVLFAMLFALMRLYRVREQRLQGLTTEEFKTEMMVCLKRAAILMATCFGIGFVMLLVLGLVMALGFSLHPAVGFLAMLAFYVVLIVVAVPLMLVEPIYMMEDQTGIVEALRKAWRLGFATWFGIFGVTFVIGLLASVVQTVTMGPWYIMFIIKTVFTVSNDLDGSFVNSFAYTFFEYLTCILECLGMLLSMVFTTIGLTIQYGHASDKIDGTGVAQNIEKFDELDNF